MPMEKGWYSESILIKVKGTKDKVSVAQKEAFLADPGAAIECVDQSGVDSLAIAIGTSHGAYKFKGGPMKQTVQAKMRLFGSLGKAA